MAQQQLTPMMQQYRQIKNDHPDCILFFRLGDFYEMFDDDARTAAQELDLTLTSRDRTKEKNDPNRIPMCGIPYHSSEGYIARLVSKGYKVAICEQMEDPATAKGLVKRDITRIVTPGTVTESSMLDERRNNYFACAYGRDGIFGLCFCDVSTGSFYATCLSGPHAVEQTINELARFSPSELLLGGEASEVTLLPEALQARLHCCVDRGDDALFALDAATAVVEQQFRQSLAALGLEAVPAVICAAGALLATLHRVQKSDLGHIRAMDYYLSGRFLELDLTAIRNLELTETLRSKEKRGSLLWVLDKTVTALGGRLLRSWLEKPLLSPALIGKRLSAVEELVQKTVDREELRQLLREVSDFERVMARIVNGTANGRDLLSLANGCACLPELKHALGQLDSSMAQTLAEQLDDLSDLKARIDRAIVDDPPFTVREGKLIRPGYSEEADRLRDILSGGNGAMAEIEAREKELTGIKTLKVGYNRVFGYYIEISKSLSEQAPAHYIRKQTLTNCERYITPELKELENTILTAKDRITSLEYELFNEVREWLAGQADRVRLTAGAVATADVLSNLAHVAVHNHYCRPEVDFSGEIVIKDGRHPVVEQMLEGSLFVANDTTLGVGGDNVAILTGPNMAGKSTYMRQVALMVLMAQMGSFVPAKSARLGIVDRLFTRIGASDDLSSGQSTFMVEMTEVAEILRNATPRSLLILDEIGRGTSTFDGMAIARAVLEHTADRKKLGAKTLFATHYHELTVMEQELPGVKNYNIAVKKKQDEVIFLRKIVPGGADDSFGVDVAKMAGLPDSVIRRARQLLHQLESGNGAPVPAPAAAPVADDQVSLLDMTGNELRQKLQAMTVETMTPIEALNALYQLKQLADKGL
ncbi:DNA mismatch repair protein MutS [Candidatus Avoscillospira sp. LCP25S3_F1]|uniref:DNA mismatch repair protein MutS n=1 Tax=Candidatus Avoscillospira sp. LCP25S3_F1 TaxID=3438825 RepID=UPI003F92CA52